MDKIKEPVTCKGCGNVPEHCICEELTKAAKQVQKLLIDKKKFRT